MRLGRLKEIYSKGIKMTDCLFCKIAKGEVDHYRVYEDEKTFAFLDISPAVEQGGHVLVLPKNHYELITDIPDDELIALSKTLKKVSKSVLKFGEGMNIVQNNKKVAGQVVPHLHFHLIPRFEGDDVKIDYWEAKKLSSDKMEEIAEKIKKLI